MSTFLRRIPARLQQTIHTFCTDMWDGYLGAIAEMKEASPQLVVKTVIDRFHVAKGYRAGFDTLRKQEMRRLRQQLSPEAYQQVAHGMHWLLRYNYDQLDETDKARLRQLFQYAPLLHQAYTLREELTAIFNMRLTVEEGKHRLEQWQAKVKRSSLTCFDTFVKSLSKYLLPIANYFDRRANSGFVEGINNKLKTCTRRSYGIKRVDSLFRRLWLDITGYQQFLA